MIKRMVKVAEKNMVTIAIFFLIRIEKMFSCGKKLSCF
jgi:hypothetical protein